MLDWIILILNLVIITILVYPVIFKKKTEKYSIFDDIIDNIVKINAPNIDIKQTLNEAEKEEDPCKTLKPIISNRQIELKNLLKIASDLECKME
jgi:hypothetical protein